jgi:hypothetical protein
LDGDLCRVTAALGEDSFLIAPKVND